MEMLSTYKKLYDHIMISAPTVVAQGMITNHLNQILNFYKTNRSLATGEILDIMYSNRADPLLREKLNDVYERYENTNFLISGLNKADIDFIKQRYIEEIVKFGKGYVCAIQT